MDFNTFLLDFPNNEVKNGFLTLVASSYLTPEEETEGWIRSAVVAMRKGDVKTLQTMSRTRFAVRKTKGNVNVISSIHSISSCDS